MLNLNIGGVVFHAGKKRTVEAIKDVVGQTFLKLNGHAYLVRLEHVKPVGRLPAVLVAACGGASCAFDRLSSSDAVRSGRFVGRGPANIYARSPRQWNRQLSIDSEHKGV